MIKTDQLIAAALVAAGSFTHTADRLGVNRSDLVEKERARAALLKALAEDSEVAERLAGALFRDAPAPDGLGEALETGYAHAQNVVANWSSGDLAGAVNGLEEWANGLPEAFPGLEFTEFEGDDDGSDDDDDPDLTPLAVRDIRPGDAVDLEGAPGCTGDSFVGAEFELAEVVGFELETPDCLRLDFGEFPSVGFDPATILPVRVGPRDCWLVGRAIKGAKPGEPAQTLLAGFLSEGEAVEFLDGPSTDKLALRQGEYSIDGPAED